MQLANYKWKQSSSLGAVYCNDYEQVKDLFEHHFQHDSSWERSAEAVDQGKATRVDRNELSAVLAEYNRELGNAPEALNNISRLNDERTLVIAGGQQAGLFTGPLLVMYKAITIIQAAKEAERRLNRPVVPVFWIAGEDHDVDEVNHIFTLSPQSELERIRLVPQSSVRTSISRLEIGQEQWETAISQLEQSLTDTEYKSDLLNKLREISKSSRTLTQYFGRVMAWLFGWQGLVMLDSDHPQLRKLEAPMFHRLIENNESLNRALLNGKMNVERHGFTPQADIEDGQANLFIFEQEERLLLQRTSDGYCDKKRRHHYTTSQLLGIADNDPAQLSNNVMTRPLMQQYLLPVLATVLGPGEISYWALTHEAFRTFEMSMPLIIPRSGFTLVEGTLQKHMKKFNMSIDDVINHFEDKRQAWLDQHDSLQLAERFAEVRQQIEEIYRPVLELVGELNPGINKLGGTNLQKIIEQVTFMETRATEAFQSQFDASLRQMDRLCITIFPQNKPQERVLNVFAYLNKYGDEWLRELTVTPLKLTGEHQICYF